MRCYRFCQAISPVSAATTIASSSRRATPKSLGGAASTSTKADGLLQAIGVFCEWGSGLDGVKYLQQASLGGAGVVTGSVSSGPSALLSSHDLLREENRSRSAMRVALTAVHTSAGKLSAGKKVDDVTQPLFTGIGNDESTNFTATAGSSTPFPLPEHMELRGFSPLQSVCEVSDSIYAFLCLMTMAQ